MKKRSLLGTIVSVVIAELAGLLGFLLAGNIPAVYAELTRPPLSPPQWLFGIVWPLLYALMGAAAYLVYTEAGEAAQKRNALALYVAQLALNVLWCVVFFRWQLLWLALVVILVLLVAVFWMMRLFSRIDATTAGLVVPYLLWLAFATYLNLGIAILN